MTIKNYQINELSSGFMRNGSAISKVNEVALNLATVESGGKKWFAKGKLTGRQLKNGQVVLASYNKYNQGADVVEILGFTDNTEKYGEGGVAFYSVDEVMKAKGVKTLGELETLPRDEYGQDIYVVVRDLKSGESGPWYYLCEKRWSYGSGAEALSFVEVEEFDAEKLETQRQAEEAARIRANLESRKRNIEAEIARLKGQLESINVELGL